MSDGACLTHVLSSAGKTEVFDPTAVEYSNFRSDGAEDAENSVLALMTWPSRKGWLHGVKFLFVQGGAEGTDESVLVSRTVRCRVRDERSRFRGVRT